MNVFIMNHSLKFKIYSLVSESRTLPQRDFVSPSKKRFFDAIGSAALRFQSRERQETHNSKFQTRNAQGNFAKI
ncbi:MAG: hypothetical protein E7028_04830 [Planctomycetaceae bacterium]|nr:hypothetical protein [Planctomycetaceae bacterium]MBQ2822423.1 hypothetical protein [Thermoguttaceae bacterium]